MNALDHSAPSLLSSFSSTSTPSPKFKFPAKPRTPKPSPFKSSGNLVRASSSLSATSNEDTSVTQSVDQHVSRRRGLIFTATLPLLAGIHESFDRFDANAAVAYTTIQEEVKKVVSKGKAAGVLRLVFHDAGTFDKNDKSGGMNGSILYELERPENTGLKKPVKILEKVKSQVDEKGKVSWADMIAVAGAEAVSLCGGPVIPVRLGRIDSMVPDPEGRLPEETLDASGLKECFLQKGFSTQELVALSGAHTLGSKGFGNPTTFDNSYFKILMEKPWLYSAGMSSQVGLPSDRALPEDEECLRWIRVYAEDQNTFFEDFKNAYIKLVDSGAMWKSV